LRGDRLGRALTPKAEIEGEMGEPQMGLQARLMSQALRKLTANIKRSNTLVIFINQIRMKIGVMFGNPRPPPAATRSSSTPRCASTSAASARSRRARR
jgi:RecA/RadA recombinase